jgi:hypothetical protein
MAAFMPAFRTAMNWVPPTCDEIRAQIEASGRTREDIARRSDLSLDKLKRLTGSKSNRLSGSPPARVSFGDWLALGVACSACGLGNAEWLDELSPSPS